MSIASASALGAPSPEQARRPGGLWAAAIVYAWAAFGPIPFYYYLRAASDLPAERWVGTTPFDQYLGVGLLYHASAALSCYWLLKRRALAVWVAAFVAVWSGLQAVAAVRGVLRGLPAEPTSWGVPLIFGLFVLLALYVRALRRRGVLQ